MENGLEYSNVYRKRRERHTGSKKEDAVSIGERKETEQTLLEKQRSDIIEVVMGMDGIDTSAVEEILKDG